MPNVEYVLHGNVDDVVDYVGSGVRGCGLFIFEREGSDVVVGDVRCVVRVFQRAFYATMVSLTIVAVGHGDRVHLLAITSGDAGRRRGTSRAERTFLNALIAVVDAWQREYQPPAPSTVPTWGSPSTGPQTPPAVRDGTV